MIDELKEERQVYSMVMDNVGHNPNNLAQRCHEFVKPTGSYVFIGGSGQSAGHMARSMLLPQVLGGCQRSVSMFITASTQEDQELVAYWLSEGKLQTILEKTFAFDEAIDAILHLKKGSSRGKITIEV